MMMAVHEAKKYIDFSKNFDHLQYSSLVMLRLEVRVLQRGNARSHATLLPGKAGHIRYPRHNNPSRDSHHGGRASTAQAMPPLPVFDKRLLAVSLPGSGCKLRRSRRRHGLHLQGQHPSLPVEGQHCV